MYQYILPFIIAGAGYFGITKPISLTDREEETFKLI